jgi:hypothetical protein
MVIRIIHNRSYNAHTDSLFKSSAILPLPLLADFFKLLFMRQHKFNNLPVSFGDTWITNAERREDNEDLPALHNQEDYYVPFTRLQSTDIHPLIYFPKLLNNFPSEIRSTSHQNILKKELKAPFLDQLSDNFKCGRLLCPHCHL